MTGSTVRANSGAAGSEREPRVSVSLLGPLELRVDGHVRVLTAEKERTVLAMLALAGAEGITSLGLIDELWEAPTHGSKSTLQTYISNLRKLTRVDDVVIERIGERYRLVPGSVQVDVEEFRSRLSTARSLLAEVDADRRRALSEVNSALGQLRGPLDPSIVKGAGQLAAESTRIHDEALEARWIWADLEIEAGRAASVVGELRAVVNEDPMEERFWRQLMLAYWKSGRQQMALDAYQEVRQILADELGVMPDPSLQDLEGAILRHDPQLDQADAVGQWILDHGSSRTIGDGSLTNLRPATRVLWGRETELDGLVDRLRREPLVTVVGAPGVGKTMLAGEAGRRLLKEHRHGVWFVDVAPLRSRTDLEEAILHVLGRSHAGGADAMMALRDVVASRHLVLIVDNCEHLVDEVRLLLDEVLTTAAPTRIVVTSREPLGLEAEAVMRLDPLPVPGDDQGSVEDVGASPAVGLFVERFRQADPAFRLTPTTGPLLARICGRLDGLPLALELAAGQASVLSLAEIERHLGQRFRLLRRPAGRSARAHHETLWAALDWSVQRLTAELRTRLAELSVFRGAFSLSNAAGVWNVDDLEAARLIAALQQSSMVASTVNEHSDRFFRLLESIREFSAADLDPEDAMKIRARHADVFSAISTETTAGFVTADVPRWLAYRDTVAADLDQAIAYLGEHESSQAADMLRNLSEFFRISGRASTFLRLVELIPEGSIADAAGALLHAEAAHFCSVLGRSEELERHVRASEAMATSAGVAVPALAAVADAQRELVAGNTEQAFARVSEAAALVRGESAVQAGRSLAIIGYLSKFLGVDGGLELCREGLRLNAEVSPARTTVDLSYLSLAHLPDDPDSACRYGREAITEAAQLRSKGAEAMARFAYATSLAARGEVDLAAEEHARAIPGLISWRYEPFAATSIEQVARFLASTAPGGAVELLAAVWTHRTGRAITGAALVAKLSGDLLSQVEDDVGSDDFERYCEVGSGLNLRGAADRAVALYELLSVGGSPVSQVTQ